MYKSIERLMYKLDNLLHLEITRKRFLALSAKFIFLTIILSFIPIKWSKESSPMSRMRKKMLFNRDMYLKHGLAG
ncbi:MAG: hypothetical protein P9X27_05045 [Candidatus Kaelpia aquatica]|nr:hypothetical protein [Candidatus Kaelpia aquatica]